MSLGGGLGSRPLGALKPRLRRSSECFLEGFDFVVGVGSFVFWEEWSGHGFCGFSEVEEGLIFGALFGGGFEFGAA